MKHRKSPIALVILDGFGYSPSHEGNAIALAHTPFINYLMHTYPSTILQASGTAVGIPEGVIGNSEVGHITIGAGRIVQQPITLLQEMVIDGSLAAIPLWQDIACQMDPAQTIHIIGLDSDAGVHGHINHLLLYTRTLAALTSNPIAVHLITDGRDVAPQSAAKYLERFCSETAHFQNVHIASISGRYYAMDRDKNWDRTNLAVKAMSGVGGCASSWEQVISENYKQGINDEFIVPMVLNPSLGIKAQDIVIFANFRPDRMRQLVSEIAELNPAIMISPIDYGNDVKTTVLIERTAIPATLKEVLAANNKSIFTIAETEKYAHVTYFFSGYKEEHFVGEVRRLIPSHKVKTYAHDPAMSAVEITNAVLATGDNLFDFYLINYANADMVGHSGDLAAAIAAIEVLDKELERLYRFIVHEHNGTMIVTADHGNAEAMIDPTTKQPQTAHTTNSVPCIVATLAAPILPLPSGGLSSIAPYILRSMGLPIPDEMR